MPVGWRVQQHDARIPCVSSAGMRQLTSGRHHDAGFGWDSCDKGNWYKQVQEKIPEIKEAGFTHVWLPPPSESVAKQVRAAWWRSWVA